MSLKRFFRRLFSAKRPFKLTPAGWVFILYTIGVGAGAINTGNNLLYLIFGVFLGVLLASGLLSDLSLWGLDVEWEFPQSGEADQLSFIRLKITNTKKRIPSLSVNIELKGELQGKPVVLYAHVPMISAKETVGVPIRFQPGRRGWFQLTGIKSFTKFPFGLLQKWWTIHFPENKFAENSFDSRKGMFVYPASLDIGPPGFEKRFLRGDQTPVESRRGEGTTVYGLREYNQSDSPRHINWKASAKRSSPAEAAPFWLVREMERDEKEELLLLWPAPQVFRKLSDAEIEQLIRFAVSLLKSGRESGHQTRFWIQNDDSPTKLYLIRGGENDESDRRFLSLWDPRAFPSESLFQFLEPVFAEEVNRGEVMGVLSLFNRWSQK